MNRRQSLLAIGSAAAVMSMHATQAATAASANRKPPPFDLLVQPATDALLKGQNCLSYCIYQLGEGRKEMAAVARAVNELLPLCEATLALVAQHGKQLAGLTTLLIAAAESCQAECRKYSPEHAQCQACADACAVMIKAGRQFQTEMAEFEKTMKAG